VVETINHVLTRAYTLHAGPGDDIQVEIEHDRVIVRTKGEFLRPTRLSPLEALALALGLRMLAAEARGSGRADLLALASRLERDLAPPPEEDEAATSRRRLEALNRRLAASNRQLAGDPVEPAAADPPPSSSPLALELDADDVLGVLADAAREKRWCVLTYIKSGAPEPEKRRIAPYRLAHAQGRWYVLAHDGARGALRVFRVDRVLSAAVDAEGFEIPAGFDPAGWITPDGAVFRADEDERVAVRYSKHIARWIAERLAHEPQPDGSIVVHHRVADVRWIARHVLQYAGEAEVLEPAHVRALVAEAGERLAG